MPLPWDKCRMSKWQSQGWIAKPVRWSQFVHTSHRTTEAQCWFPPPISLPLNCMAPLMWEDMPPENLRSGCRNIALVPETLVMPEWLATEVTRSLLPEWWFSLCGVSFWWKSIEPETWSLELLLWFWSYCWSSFLLRKRPPEPLTLFSACWCRDSWRYGCIHSKVRRK